MKAQVEISGFSRSSLESCRVTYKSHLTCRHFLSMLQNSGFPHLQRHRAVATAAGTSLQWTHGPHRVFADGGAASTTWLPAPRADPSGTWSLWLWPCGGALPAGRHRADGAGAPFSVCRRRRPQGHGLLCAFRPTRVPQRRGRSSSEL